MFKKNFPGRIGLGLVVVFLALQAMPAIAAQPVVVELFTSEGCSSCPPADALLTQLNHIHMVGDTELILLEEHVEYWNSPGWTDRFSAPVYTQRQEDYVRQLHLATAYTPQMVVDGHLQGSGGNAKTVQSMITEASKSPKNSVVSLHLVSPDKLQVNVEDPGPGSHRVLFVVTENDLTSNVRGGENGGHTLKHSAVVRELRSLGSTSKGQFATTVSLPAKSDWKKPDLQAIVMVQDSKSGLILGAASIPYSSGSSAAAGR